MANEFGADILIQAADPMEAASFYVKELGFEVTNQNPGMVSLHGDNINLFIERGPALGPVLEVTVKRVSLRSSGSKRLRPMRVGWGVNPN